MIETPLGYFSFESREGFLTRCVVSSAPGLNFFGDAEQRRGKLVDHVAEAFGAYFAGDLYALSEIPIWPVGTLFQLKVWRELLRIPPGETRTYSEIAAEVGKPRSAQAVGGACAANPLLLFVPCHRVVSSDGSLGGFVGGEDVKRGLLDHESRFSVVPPAPFFSEHLAALH